MFISGILASTLVGASIASAAAQSFKDVDSSYWGYEAIQWGVKQKIATGYEDGTFKPNKSVTEEEFITLLVRAFGSETTTKEKEQRWSDRYFRVAVDHNLPVSDDRTANINRQDVAEIIVGTQGVNFSGDDAIQYMLNKGLTKGKTSATVEGYKGQDTLTRAEAVAFIKNVLDKAENKTMLVRPNKPSPKSLLTQSEETQTTEQKPIVTLDQVVQTFNASLNSLGLESLWSIQSKELSLNQVAHDYNDYYSIYEVHKQNPSNIYDGYSLSISTLSETGEVDSLKVSIRGGVAKDIIQSMIAAFMQDEKLGKDFYVKHEFSKLIDEATGNKGKAAFDIEDGEYKAKYSLQKFMENGVERPLVHIFTFYK